MWESKMEFWLLWHVILAILVFTGTCRCQEARSCEYTYILQPPNELWCNPYRFEEATNSPTYSINLLCVVAQFERKDGPELRWVQVLSDSEPQEIIGNPFNPPTTDKIDSEGVNVFLSTSVLEINNMAPPNGSHTYWCELSTVNEETQRKTCMVLVNRLTIYDPDNYTLFPVCSERDTITERVCACADRNRPSTDDAPCSSTDNCDTTGTSCNNTATEDNSGSTSTVVIVGAVVGAVVLVLLVVVIVELVVCCICMKKKRKDSKHGAGIKTERFSSVIPTENQQQEINYVPPAASSCPEIHSSAVVSDRDQEPTIARPVAPQSPNRPPPTHVETHKMPVSAQKRAASLLRQLQRPHKSVDKPKGNGAAVTSAENSTNEQESTPRKKPYKSLEVKTVDGPSFYMTRAKSPMQGNRKKKPPPMCKPRENHRTVSKEKLLLSETTSSGYIVPTEMNEVQEMYTQIEPGTQDYLGLYTVPHQRRSSSSSEEQPIYAEPVVYID